MAAVASAWDAMVRCLLVACVDKLRTLEIPLHRSCSHKETGLDKQGGKRQRTQESWYHAKQCSSVRHSGAAAVRA